MTVDSYSGTWILDPGSSDLKSPPAHWQQVIRIKGNSVSVREEIDRESGRSVTEVFAFFDGEYYRVHGSPLVDEIAYTFEADRIKGSGRRQGVDVLNEILSLLDPDTIKLALTMSLSGREISLGSAIFRRA